MKYMYMCVTCGCACETCDKYYMIDIHGPHVAGGGGRVRVHSATIFTHCCFAVCSGTLTIVIHCLVLCCKQSVCPTVASFPRIVHTCEYL